MKRMVKFLILSVFISIILFVSVYANDEEDNKELKISVLKPGTSCDRTAKFNDIVKVHIEGFLEDGKQIESSYDRGNPLLFQLGYGQVIKGIENGVFDMCVGEKRKLVIPPHLGYGDQDNGAVPAGSTMTFNVELVAIEDGTGVQDAFLSLDIDKNGFLDMNEVNQHLDKAANLNDLPVKMDHSMKYRMLQTIFMQLDQDKDGMLNSEEFNVLEKLAQNYKPSGNVKVEL